MTWKILSVLLFAAGAAFAQETIEEQLAARQPQENNKVIFPQTLPLAGLRLMFTEQERLSIDHALSPDLYDAPETLDGTGSSVPSPEDLKLPPPLFLAGLSYENPDSWSLWLNGTRLRSGKATGEFEILNINRHGVEVIWRPILFRGVYHVVLRPRQTFLPELDQVVDGDARTKDPAGDTKQP